MKSCFSMFSLSAYFLTDFFNIPPSQPCPRMPHRAHFPFPFSLFAPVAPTSVQHNLAGAVFLSNRGICHPFLSHFTILFYFILFYLSTFSFCLIYLACTLCPFLHQYTVLLLVSITFFWFQSARPVVYSAPVCGIEKK